MNQTTAGTEMNWDAVGAIAELLGAVGVLVTLIYLSLQIRANTNQSRLTTIESILGREIANRENAIDSRVPEIGIAFERGEVLSPEDERRLTFHVQGTLQSWELAFFMYSSGSLPQDVFKSIEFRRLNRPVIREYWGRFKMGFTPDFRDYVDDLYENEE